jgi:hypothetical protein
MSTCENALLRELTGGRIEVVLRRVTPVECIPSERDGTEKSKDIVVDNDIDEE